MGRAIEWSGETSLSIAATADDLYHLVADVTRMGEWSPECRRCEWVDGSTRAEIGARFRGHNRWLFVNRWSRLNEVIVADPGREFAFKTVPTRVLNDSTLWRYRFEPDVTDPDQRTLVTESYESLKPPPWYIVLLDRLMMRHHFDMRPHMMATLEKIRATAEVEMAGSVEHGGMS